MTVFCFNLCTQWFVYGVFGLCVCSLVPTNYLWYYLQLSFIFRWCHSLIPYLMFMAELRSHLFQRSLLVSLLHGQVRCISNAVPLLQVCHHPLHTTPLLPHSMRLPMMLISLATHCLLWQSTMPVSMNTAFYTSTHMHCSFTFVDGHMYI